MVFIPLGSVIAGRHLSFEICKEGTIFSPFILVKTRPKENDSDPYEHVLSVKENVSMLARKYEYFSKSIITPLLF